MLFRSKLDSQKQPLYSLWEEVTGGGKSREYLIWAKRQNEEYQDKTGDAPAVSLDYRNDNGYHVRLRQWIRDKVKKRTKSEEKTVESFTLPEGAYTHESHVELMKAMGRGEVDLDTFKAAFEKVIVGEGDIKADLKKLKKKELLGLTSSFHYRMSDNKATLVRAAYSGMIDRFALGQPITFEMSMSYISKGKDTGKIDSLREMVESTTEDDLKRYAEKYQADLETYKKEIESRKKAIDNPETFKEYQFLVDVKGVEGLTLGQRIQWDELQSEKTGEEKAKDKDQKATVKAVTSEGDRKSVV